ncbi:hypothetical protein LJR230_003755 [Trinickia sp. LjRoot230]|uniref:hypothetical protein n=1 Tax=Trinickia sp. LjRoot230 TaxID=3342288 RepID=UPI003ECF71CE
MTNVSGAGGSNHADWSSAVQGDADQSSATGAPAEGEARPQSRGFTLDALAALGGELANRMGRLATGDGSDVESVTVAGMVELPSQDGGPGPQVRVKLRYDAVPPKEADPVEPADTEAEGQG